MLLQNCVYGPATIVLISIYLVATATTAVEGRPYRILLDTDVDTDDLFALLYLLKLSPSEFDLQAVTISTNAWTDAGHAVNQVYDILYMMDRDDIAVGVGGEGGILEDGTIKPDVGGYLPIIEQINVFTRRVKFYRMSPIHVVGASRGIGTAGYCRYRQTIPVGSRGRLDFDTNFGFRKSFLPQGSRKYLPLRQPTAQKVMTDKISAGPITIFAIGAQTNLAIFLMNNSHLKKNIEHIYIMGGGVRSGNLYTAYRSNPYAEFNIFGDPFAAYQVIHSGIPITLVPLDATDTIPITKQFFDEFEKNQQTYEAQYCFKSLKIFRDTWPKDDFYTSYSMWDTFTVGVATSIMRQVHNNGENEFAKMEYMNITVVTSNQPYDISDGSNPFFDGLKIPKFNLKRNGVHSGHVQTGIHDPFCLVQNGRGKCMDGRTAEVAGSEAVRVLVATTAKPNRDNTSLLNREFLLNFLEVINRHQNSGRFNFTTQFPYCKEVLYKPSFVGNRLGKKVVFDMDMSLGDFLALFYLLKLPVEVIDLKAILVSPTGWANAATIDVIYDLLHMMGRDDIPVGLGDVFAINQSYPSSAAGDCKYNKAIPNGSGGLLDSDTLYGFARQLPRSPRRYTAENSVKFGAPRDTDHPELRQPLALEIWDSLSKSLKEGSKITILTNGPLTNLARIILSRVDSSSLIEEVLIVGGHINYDNTEKGDLFNVPSNEYAEFNIFLDPLAAKVVFDSKLDITLIPLSTRRKVSSFQEMIQELYITNQTSEALFARRLLSKLQLLKQTHQAYGHMETFLGELLGAAILGGDLSVLNCTFKAVPVKVSATGIVSQDGEMTVDEKNGKLVRVLENLDTVAYHGFFANRLGDQTQTAAVGSFDEQRRIWSAPSTRRMKILI